MFSPGETMNIDQQRCKLTQYLNHDCLCSGTTDQKSPPTICLRDVFVNDLHVRHLWIKTAVFDAFPLNTRVYFTGVVISYQKRNFTILSYTLDNIQIISKHQYRRQMDFQFPKPKEKTLKHLQRK